MHVINAVFLKLCALCENLQIKFYVSLKPLNQKITHNKVCQKLK